MQLQNGRNQGGRDTEPSIQASNGRVRIPEEEYAIASM